MWGRWKDYNKVNVNGTEYAQIGDRLYTRHAVDRMQPSGMRYQGGKLDGGDVSASRIFDVDQKDYGRSISPNFVEDIIKQGNYETQIVNGIERQVWSSGSVKVVTENQGKTVITILTK